MRNTGPKSDLRRLGTGDRDQQAQLRIAMRSETPEEEDLEEPKSRGNFAKQHIIDAHKRAAGLAVDDNVPKKKTSFAQDHILKPFSRVLGQDEESKVQSHKSSFRDKNAAN